MSAKPQPHRVVLTYDDYRRMPEDGRRYELFEGELYVTPSPAIVHQRVSRNLELMLAVHVRQHKLGEVLDAPVDVILGRTTVVQPDLLFVAAERRDIVSKRGIEGPPDLVVEILSPSTEDIDRGVKEQLYARYGVRYYWMIDPTARSFSELVLGDGAYARRATHPGHGVIRTELFPDLGIDLDELFSE